MFPTSPDGGKLNKLDWLKAAVCLKGAVFGPKAKADCAFVGAAELNNWDGWVLRKLLVPNGEDVPWEAVLNRDVDDLNACDEELSPNGAGVGVPKVEGAAADDVEEGNDEEGNGGELKAEAEVPNVFGANGI